MIRPRLRYTARGRTALLQGSTAGILSMPQLDVFVSHLHVESKFADVLREHLDRDFIGLLKLFISTDSTSIPVGTQWFDVLLGWPSVRALAVHSLQPGG